ncbi:hypothetical protein THAOC_25768, partial [Thalassiosira oceanica]
MRPEHGRCRLTPALDLELDVSDDDSPASGSPRVELSENKNRLNTSPNVLAAHTNAAKVAPPRHSNLLWRKDLPPEEEESIGARLAGWDEHQRQRSDKATQAGGSPREDDDVPAIASQDVAVSRLEQRMNLMEASFQREILEVKRAAAVELHAKSSAIESRLSSLQDETDRLKAKVMKLDEENRRLEAAFKLHVKNSDWEYTAPDPPPDSYWIEKGYDYGDEDITDDDYIDNINGEFFWRARRQSKMLMSGICGLEDRTTEFYFGDGANDSPLIRYDDALLPHWVEFYYSMSSWLSSPVRGTIERTYPFNVYICNIELPANVLQELSKCFQLE